jgi:hypothetical protein
MQQGFTALSKNFNGFQELLSRKDAGKALIQIYKDLNVEDISKKSDLVKQGDYAFEFTYLELLIAQNEIIQQLTSGERQTLRKLTISKFDEKKELKELFGEFGLNTSSLILGKILKADGKKDVILKTTKEADFDIYLNTAQFRDGSLLTNIYNASQSY